MLRKASTDQGAMPEVFSLSVQARGYFSRYAGGDESGLWDTAGMGIRFAGRTEWGLGSNRLTRAVEARRASGRGVVDLTESNPTRVGLAVPAEWLAPMAGAEALQYDPDPLGMRRTREAVAEYYAGREREGRVRAAGVDAGRVVLTTATSEAYAHGFRLLCDAGDEVLVPQPSYPLLQFLADLQDVKLKPYELVYDHGWQIDFVSLRAAIGPRTRAVVLVHPNNPTGSAVWERERAELNAVAEEFGLALVVDEVFLDYAVEGEAPRSFADNEGALTLTLSGLSKICCLPQMKLGWMVVSGPEAEEAMARLEVIADTFLSVGTPVQVAAGAMLAGRERVQGPLRARVRANLAELDRVLPTLPACSRLAVEAGWYAVVRVPVVGSDEELALRVLEEAGVLVHPGHFFDFQQEGYVVVSLIPPEDVFAGGVGAMGGVLATL